MAQPYVGEIRMFAGTFEPVGWAFCDGTPMPIAQNEVLFQLIGTTFGGDGQASFNLPNLQGRIPLHRGPGPDSVNYPFAQAAGTEQETLTIQQIPIHNHAALASLNNAGASVPTGNLTGQVGATQIYREATPASAMKAGSLSPAGGSQPHENCQPFTCINYIISLFGIFPSQT